jgi:hypothetical protein
MDSAFQQRLLAALQQRIHLVADRDFYQRDPSGHLAALQNAAAELDRLIAELPPSTDPMLRHYLERQSYLKAIAFLSEV